MNNDTRKRIDLIMSDIEKTAKLRQEIDEAMETITEKIKEYQEIFDDAKSMIEEIRDEEQEKFDNLSEGLQQSEKGQTLEATVSALDEAMSPIESFEISYDMYDGLNITVDPDEIIGALDNAKYAG